MKKIFLTGADGFIGSHLCDRLLDRGAEVVCLDNLLATRGSDKNIAHLKGNSSFSFLQQSVEESLPADLMQSINFVFHQAASKNTVSIDNLPTIKNIHLLNDIILVDTNEKINFVKHNHNYLIEQVLFSRLLIA